MNRTPAPESPSSAFRGRGADAASTETLETSRREPLDTPARIAPLANLPLFHRIAGRKAVVAGGSDGAVWKAELLAAAGADVLVLAGDASAKFESIPALTVLPRCWTPDDLEGAALAVGDP
ncbi:MAG TPA: NAD(P)-dependent oxidoreductase, partial [Allosphingosinicella sp.]